MEGRRPSKDVFVFGLEEPPLFQTKNVQFLGEVTPPQTPPSEWSYAPPGAQGNKKALPRWEGRIARSPAKLLSESCGHPPNASWPSWVLEGERQIVEIGALDHHGKAPSAITCDLSYHTRRTKANRALG